jgi:MFS family permease
MSDREGYRAMVAFFTFAPFGALIGLVLGIGLVLRYRGGHRGLAALAWRIVLVIAGVAGAIALGLWAYSLTDDVLVRNALPPQLVFEIRLPANTALPSEGVTVDLNTDKNTMPATFTQTTDGDRPLLSGRVELYFWSSSRLLVLRIPGEPDRLFQLKLAGNPPASAEFSRWQRVDYVADGPDGDLRKGTDADAYDIRYRVERSD